MSPRELRRRAFAAYVSLGYWLFGDLVPEDDEDGEGEPEPERGRLVVVTADSDEAERFVAAMIDHLAGGS